MGKETDFLIFVLWGTCFLASVGGGKLCDFDKKFEHVRPTCHRWSKDKANDAPTSQSSTATQDDRMVSTANTDMNSKEYSSGIDCFKVIENKTIQIKNGSSTVNANCTRMVTCLNGKMHFRGEYNCSCNAVCEVRNEEHKCYCINGYHGDGKNCTTLRDCWDIFKAGHTTDGIYAIKPSNWSGPPFNVYCNMSEGGGWTVFQRRVNGLVDFYRNWTSYKEGFGDLDHEFWLGNDKLYYLTNQSDYKLRIDLKNKNGTPFFAEYELFRTNDEKDNYKLSNLGNYSGNAGYNSLWSNLNKSFSTFDNDNDQYSGICAVTRHGGWWYGACGKTNLNGNYDARENSDPAIAWTGLEGGRRNLKYTEMKIRPTE